MVEGAPRLQVSRYFDPTRREVVVTPPPVVRPVAPQTVPPAAYFDPSKPRLVRPEYPTVEEIRAYVHTLPSVVFRSLELLAGEKGEEPVFALVWRRVAHVQRCPACHAPGSGDLGHRPPCRIFAEWRYRNDNWWFGRKRREPDEMPDPEPGDDELPF